MFSSNATIAGVHLLVCSQTNYETFVEESETPLEPKQSPTDGSVASDWLQVTELDSGALEEAGAWNLQWGT